MNRRSFFKTIAAVGAIAPVVKAAKPASDTFSVRTSFRDSGTVTIGTSHTSSLEGCIPDEEYTDWETYNNRIKNQELAELARKAYFYGLDKAKVKL